MLYPRVKSIQESPAKASVCASPTLNFMLAALGSFAIEESLHPQLNRGKNIVAGPELGPRASLRVLTMLTFATEYRIEGMTERLG